MLQVSGATVFGIQSFKTTHENGDVIPNISSSVESPFQMGYLVIKTRKPQKAPNIDTLNAHVKHSYLA